MYKFIAAAFILTVCAGELFAQAVQEERPTGAGVRSQDADAATPPSTQPGARTTTGGQQRTQAAGLDQHIATCLLLGNKEEIALAEFAQARSQNEQVKQFAQMLIEHHQEAISKIQQAAPQTATLDLELKPAATPRTAARAGGAATAAGQATTQPAAAQGSQDQQMVAMGKRIAEECLSLTQAALGEKQGADFDKAFVHQQCVAHIGMLAKLRGSQPYASGQLKPVIQEGAQMTERHLAEAKNLLTQLKDTAAPRQARVPQ